MISEETDRTVRTQIVRDGRGRQAIPEDRISLPRKERAVKHTREQNVPRKNAEDGHRLPRKNAVVRCRKRSEDVNSKRT